MYTDLINRLFEEAKGLKSAGKLDEAIKIYLQIIDKEPGNHCARVGLAAIHRQKGDRIAENKCMNELLGLIPKDYHQAEAWYTEALNFDPECTHAKVGLAACYCSWGRNNGQPERYKRAVELYDEVLMAEPDNVFVHRGLIRVYRYKGNNPLADQHEKVIDFLGGNRQIHAVRPAKKFYEQFLSRLIREGKVASAKKVKEILLSL